MTNEHESAPQSAVGPLDPRAITTAEVTERLSRRLRQLIGPGRRWSYRGVAERSGIDERTLKAYVAGESCPNLAKYKRLLAVLGPELTSDIDRMHGWLPRLGETMPPGSVDLAELRAELAQTLEAIDALLARSEVPDSPPSSAAGRPPRSHGRRR
jgi:transcriptional regulator with XRE-family HTH domain